MSSDPAVHPQCARAGSPSRRGRLLRLADARSQALSRSSRLTDLTMEGEALWKSSTAIHASVRTSAPPDFSANNHENAESYSYTLTASPEQVNPKAGSRDSRFGIVLFDY